MTEHVKQSPLSQRKYSTSCLKWIEKKVVVSKNVTVFLETENSAWGWISVRLTKNLSLLHFVLEISTTPTHTHSSEPVASLSTDSRRARGLETFFFFFSNAYQWCTSHSPQTCHRSQRTLSHAGDKERIWFWWKEVTGSQNNTKGWRSNLCQRKIAPHSDWPPRDGNLFRFSHVLGKFFFFSTKKVLFLFNFVCLDGSAGYLINLETDLLHVLSTQYFGFVVKTYFVIKGLNVQGTIGVISGDLEL